MEKKIKTVNNKLIRNYAFNLIPRIPEVVEKLSNNDWNKILRIVSDKHKFRLRASLNATKNLNEPYESIDKFLNDLINFSIKNEQDKVSFTIDEISKIRKLDDYNDIESSYDLEGIVLSSMEIRINDYKKEELSKLNLLLKNLYATRRIIKVDADSSNISNKENLSDSEPILIKYELFEHNLSEPNVEHFKRFCDTLDNLPNPIRKDIIDLSITMSQKEYIQSTDIGKLLSSYGEALKKYHKIIGEKVVKWSEDIIEESKSLEEFLDRFKDTRDYFKKNIENLSGGTLLSDIHGRLLIYLQALTGKPIKIEKSETSELYCSFNEGKFLLPISINIMEKNEENFEIYKAIASYQAGAFIFGTYDIDTSKLDKKIREKFGEDKSFINFLKSFNNPDFSQNLFEILEFSRIDYRLKEKFPGLRKGISNLKNKLLIENPISLTQKIRNIVCNEELPKKPNDLEDILLPEIEILKSSKSRVEQTIDSTCRVYEKLSKKYDLTAEKPESKLIDINIEIINRGDKEKKASYLIAGPANEIALGNRFRYNEWDEENNLYKENFVQVIETPYPEVSPNNYVSEIISKDMKIIEMLKSIFESLKPEEIQIVKKQISGDIDYDLLVNAIAEKRAGITPSEKIYKRSYKNNRSVASLVLSENSGSLRKFIDIKNPELRLIDIIKKSQIYFSEALNSIGDSYALASFSGESEKNVEFYLIKDFNDQYNEDVKNKIGSIRPLKQNRDGAGIRHAAYLLSRQQEKLRLLFYMMDGNPHDFGYENEYAIKDTEKAIIESKQRGCQPIIIAYGNNIKENLRSLSEHCIYREISDPNQIPIFLPKLYKQFTV